jgi:hypothetical protein
MVEKVRALTDRPRSWQETAKLVGEVNRLFPIQPRSCELGATERTQILEVPGHARGNQRYVRYFIAAKFKGVLGASLPLFPCTGGLGRIGKQENQENGRCRVCDVLGYLAHRYLPSASLKGKPY